MMPWAAAIRRQLEGDWRFLYAEELGGWRTAGQVGADVALLRDQFARPRKALVFAFMANSYPLSVAYLAAASAGHAVALLDANLHPDLVARLLDLYRPELILAANAFPAEAVGPSWQAEPSAFPGFLVWRQAELDEMPIHPDLSILLSTSGSTGSPKFVRLSGSAVLCNAEAIAVALGLGPGEVALGHLPLHYSYGMSVLNSHLVSRGAVALTREAIITERFWALGRELNATSLAGVPYHFEVLRRLDLDRIGMPTLRTLTQAGGRAAEPLIAHLHSVMARRGGQLFVMYGQTEAAPRMTTLPADCLPAKLGSVGLPLTGGRVEIVDPQDGRILPPGQIGEVIYEGPNVMMGYAQGRAELSLGDTVGGRLATGDLGYLDADGCLFLKGRMGRIGKVLGIRINLDEVEALLAPVMHAAAIEVDEKLVIISPSPTSATMEAARALVLDRLRVSPTALRFRIIDALPVRPNGKLDYQALKGLS